MIRFISSNLLLRNFLVFPLMPMSLKSNFSENSKNLQTSYLFRASLFLSLIKLQKILISLQQQECVKCFHEIYLAFKGDSYIHLGLIVVCILFWYYVFYLKYIPLYLCLHEGGLNKILYRTSLFTSRVSILSFMSDSLSFEKIFSFSMKAICTKE